MQEITFYEVLRAKFDDEGNYTTEKSGIIFRSEGDALEFAASHRYEDCFGELATRFSKLTKPPPPTELVTKRMLIVYSDLTEYDKAKECTDRLIALEKLSQRERSLLGL
jgi:hypothetical protein